MSYSSSPGTCPREWRLDRTEKCKLYFRRDAQRKVRMRQGVPHRDPFRRIQSKQLRHKVQKISVNYIHWSHNALFPKSVSIEHSAPATTRTCIRGMAATFFRLCRDVVGVGQSSVPSALKNAGFTLAPTRASRVGKPPIVRAIIASCSRSSCVW